MTTPIDLDALEALLAKATPGTSYRTESDDPDIKLVAAAMNDLPALIRELREARASVAIASDAYRKASLELSAVAAQLRAKT